MDPDIKHLLVVIEHWRQACAKLERAVPDPAYAEAKLLTIGEQIQSLLHDQAVVGAIDELIARTHPQVVADPDTLRDQLVAKQDAIVAMEAAKPLHLSREEIVQAIVLYLHTQNDTKHLVNSRELLAWFLQLQTAIVEHYAAARSLPRKQKKRRKRNIATGVMMTAVGIGLIASNTPYDAVPAVYSYMLGGNALLQAMRDLIGEETAS
jgi:hypothetical protein